MKLHASAIVCFLLAAILYFAVLLPGLFGWIALLGVVFEGVAWGLAWMGPDDDDPPVPPRG